MSLHLYISCMYAVINQSMTKYAQYHPDTKHSDHRLAHKGVSREVYAHAF